MVRTDFDVGGLLVDVDGDGVALDVGFDGEVTEELDGEDPRLELAVLGADEDAARPSDGEGLHGLHGAADAESVMLMRRGDAVDGERGKRDEGLGAERSSREENGEEGLHS